MLSLLLLSCALVSVLAGEIDRIDYPKDVVVNCGNSQEFKWKITDTDHFDDNPSEQLEIVLVLETSGNNEEVAVLATVPATQTSYVFEVPSPFPDAWTSDENPHKIDPSKKTDVHIEIRAKGNHDINDDLPAWKFDQSFKIECISCVDGDLGCPCKMAGNVASCNKPEDPEEREYICAASGTCQKPAPQNGRGIHLKEILQDPKECGFTYTVQWEYEQEAADFFANQSQDQKKLNIYLMHEHIKSIAPVALLATVSADVTSHTVEIPTPLPLEWTASTNPGKLNNRGSKEQVLFKVESAANPSAYTSYSRSALGTIFNTGDHFDLTCCPKGFENCACNAGSCDTGLKCIDDKKCFLDTTCTAGATDCRCKLDQTCDAGAICGAKGICVAGDVVGKDCSKSTQSQLGLCATQAPDGTGPFACTDGKCAMCTPGAADCVCKSSLCDDADHACFQNHCVPKIKTGCLNCPCAAGDKCEANKALQCVMADGVKLCVEDGNAAAVTCGGQTCAAGFTCVNNECTVVGPECSASNFQGTCPAGQSCESGTCVANTACTPACTGTQVCSGGSCQETKAPPPQPDTPPTDDRCAAPCATVPECGAGQTRSEKKNECNCLINTPCVDDADNSADKALVSFALATVATFALI